jgi:two-component system, sensor histidine kinase
MSRIDKEPKLTKILLVDDLEVNLLTLRAILEDLGVELFCAISGQEALSLTLDHEFALVLMDVQMPGMNGFETAALMHGTAKTKHLPIIFITAISMEDRYVSEGYEVGAVDYLFKPVDPNILRSNVKVFIDLFEQRVLIEKQKTKLEFNVSELRAANLKSKELDRLKYEFISNISHEFRTPLNGILGMSEILLDMIDGESEKKFLEIIQSSGNSLLQLINDVLEISVSQSNQIALLEDKFNLHLALESAIGVISAEAYKKGLELDLKTDSRIPEFVFGDVARLRQILLNLLSNSLKFTKHGSISFRSTLFSQDEQNIVVDITIADTGIGISNDVVDSIFDLFTQGDGSSTRAYGGTGLGLAICKRLSDLLAAEISMESKPGEGSSFNLRIPFKSV